nr:pleiotropic drug resistance protein 3-like [Tanacetum cinerariifolium]
MSNNLKMDDDQKRKSSKDETGIRRNENGDPGDLELGDVMSTTCSYNIDRCSGAGKTILLDVLAGGKSSGTVEGEFKIVGYPCNISHF